MKIRVNKKEILYILCLMPFFKLQSFDMFVSQGHQVRLWNTIENIYNLGMIVVTVFFALDFIKRGGKFKTISSIGIILYFLFCCAISIFNQSIYLGYIFNGVTYIGLAFVCEKIMRQSIGLFEECCFYLFGILSIIGATFNILLPYGFLHSSSKAVSIYFLGSKNASYFYFAVFLYFFILRYMNKKKLKWRLGIPFALLIGLFFCDSKGGLVCYGIVALYYYIMLFWHKIYKLVNPFALFIALIFIFYFVVFNPNISLISIGLGLIGKDFEYGGRTMLWDQALELYMNHPFLGNGIQLVLMNRTAQTQAHNFYIDMLARYGTIPIMIILGIIVIIVMSMVREKNKKIVALKGVFLFSFLLHCIFDTTTIHFLLLILISVECCGKERGVQQIKHIQSEYSAIRTTRRELRV